MFPQCIDGLCIMLFNVKTGLIEYIYPHRRIDLQFAPALGYSNETKSQILISLGFF